MNNSPTLTQMLSLVLSGTPGLSLQGKVLLGGSLGWVCKGKHSQGGPGLHLQGKALLGGAPWSWISISRTQQIRHLTNPYHLRRFPQPTVQIWVLESLKNVLLKSTCINRKVVCGVCTWIKSFICETSPERASGLGLEEEVLTGRQSHHMACVRLVGGVAVRVQMWKAPVMGWVGGWRGLPSASLSTGCSGTTSPSLSKMHRIAGWSSRWGVLEALLYLLPPVTCHHLAELPAVTLGPSNVLHGY